MRRCLYQYDDGSQIQNELGRYDKQNDGPRKRKIKSRDTVRFNNNNSIYYVAGPMILQHTILS